MEITLTTLYLALKDLVIPIAVPVMGAVGAGVYRLWNKVGTVEQDAAIAREKLEDRVQAEIDTIRVKYDLEIAALKDKIATERIYNAMTFAGKADMQRLEDKLLGAITRIDNKLDGIIMMKE